MLSHVKGVPEFRKAVLFHPVRKMSHWTPSSWIPQMQMRGIAFSKMWCWAPQTVRWFHLQNHQNWAVSSNKWTLVMLSMVSGTALVPSKSLSMYGWYITIEKNPPMRTDLFKHYDLMFFLLQRNDVPTKAIKTPWLGLWVIFIIYHISCTYRFIIYINIW